jgi:two-component system C4-dicarboxylate transport sensor histidine kinase DctB
MRKTVLAVLVLTVLIATTATFVGAYRYFNRLEAQTAFSQMTLYLRTLNQTLGRHQHLPFVLANDPRFASILQANRNNSDINTRLQRLSEEADLEAIYLMDQSGVVLAASNAGQPNSFLGENYGFRPYFSEALKGHRSDYFAIGATSGRPGYFVAEPISNSVGTQNGVVAIKLDMSELQQSWESDDEVVLAVNENDIVVLASNTNWLYRPITQLDPAAHTAISESRQFGAEPLTPLSWKQNSASEVILDGIPYIMAAGEADWRGWQLHYLRPKANVTRQTLLTTAFFGSFIALLVGFATFLRSRRIGLAYAVSERQRVALLETNAQLKLAQSELARSAKLAALGHLAASVTHELGQPISAFRNHLAAAEIGGEITSPKTASSLNKLVDRMEAITSQFRYFARNKPAAKTEISLSQVLEEAVNLLKAEITVGGITLQVKLPDHPVKVFGNKIQLEQAVTNLLKNAVHAVENTENPSIIMAVTQTADTVVLRISDNGSGLGDQSLKDLQEPFYSTKPSGVGMGLGLAITTEIIADHGGELRLGNQAEGAEFVVVLPRSSTGI